MSWYITDNKDIVMTKGDTPSFEVNVNVLDAEGKRHPYELDENDVLVFAFGHRLPRGVIDPIFTKVFEAGERTIRFEENDTKDIPVGVYAYEVSLNRGDYHCTFIRDKRIKLQDEIY